MRSPRPRPGANCDADRLDAPDDAADVPAADHATADDAPHPASDHAVVSAVEPGLHHPAHDFPHHAGNDAAHADRHRHARRGLTVLSQIEHAPSYPRGLDRVVCSCGFDSGVVPGAFAWPDYDREWTDNPVAEVWRRHVAEATFQALTALGWRFDDGEPMAGRDYNPSPGGHWTGCLCKWCTKEP